MPTPIKSLGEIALRVNDLEAMQAFYENIVGLELMRRFSHTTFFKIAEGVAGHTQILALFYRGDSREPVSQPFSTIDHIAFTVSLEDFHLEQQRLEKLGQSMTFAEHAWVQWRSLYIKDPEGNTVEWVCYDPSIPLSN